MKHIERAANKIVDQLVANIGYYTDDKPIVTTEGGEARIAWNGPYDWTMNDGYGLYEELVSAGMPDSGYKEQRFFEVPKGYYAEPYSGSVLAIYKVNYDYS